MGDVRRLRTGFRYPRGCWRGMDRPIHITVRQGLIVRARLLARRRMPERTWVAEGR